MKLLTIRHNHGILVLSDASIEDGKATGIVVDGGVTNRLFTATSYRPFEKGTEMSYPVWGRKPYCTDETKDEWCMSVEFC